MSLIWKYENEDEIDLQDAVGEKITRNKKRQSIRRQAKIVGWLLAIAIITFLLLH